MRFVLLGIDSLIACIAVGPIIGRQRAVPFAALFGVCDAAGFFLGSAFRWSVAGNVSTAVQTSVLVALGCYWVTIAVFAKNTRVLPSRRAVWVLPLALSVDNITYGLVGGHVGSLIGQAGEQALSSALLAGAGLAVGIGLARAFPVTRQRPQVANGVAGALLIAASGALVLIG